MAQSFAQRVSEGRLMAAGIRAHAEELKGVSLGEEQAADIEAMVAVLQEIDTRQEKLKADLKTCTADLAAKSKALSDAVADAKKRVKLAIPSAGWQEFGISAKK